MQVRDIMIPRAQMVVIDQEASANDLLPIVVESQHSRYPVIGENRDEVVGILLAKDLLRLTFAEQKTFNLRQILRKPVFIPESKRLNVLLREFRLTRNHMAIVVDEYGGVAGLVTIEDVLEQIVGEIVDESDISDAESNIKQMSDSQYTVKALTPIQDFNDYFKTQFSDEEADTIGGLILHHLGHLPKRGETTTIAGLEFRILHADNRRVRLLRVTVLPLTGQS
jgi:magnesium and cobalt transporter